MSYMKEEVAAPVWKTEITAVGTTLTTRHTRSIRKSWH
jgi:hypothetical protein